MKIIGNWLEGRAIHCFLLVSSAVTGTVACTPCLGKTGDDLKACEADNDSGSPPVAGSGGTSESNIPRQGGTGGTASTSPNQPGASTEPSMVFGENFEHESDTGRFERSDAAKYEGMYGLRAPELNAGEQAEYMFGCGGRSHNQIEFTYTGSGVSLYVDDELYEGLAAGAGWHKRNLILPEGTHSYKWQVAVEEKGRPGFSMDAIKCIQTDPSDNSTGRWDFDQGFVPREVSGFDDAMARWQITDAAANAGGFGVRPPILPAGGITSLTMQCGGSSHTQLEFVYTGSGVDLLVDDALYETLNQGAGWHQRKLVAPAGLHTYKWSVEVDTKGRPSFWLDTIKCTSIETGENATGRWDFDQGFAPREFSGFDEAPNLRWQITDAAQNAGGFGVRPPILSAGGKTELSMKCGDKSHSELDFVYTGAGVQFLVDGALYEELAQGAGWHERKFIVPHGTHSYAWQVMADNAGRANFWLDTVKCISTDAVNNNNGRWDFDQGFVPTEMEGFEGDPATRWQITDTAQNAGGFGVRPGLLKAGGIAELALRCTTPSDGQVQFIYTGSGAELLIDGMSTGALNQGAGWHPRMVPIPAGNHKVTWKVSTTQAGRPPFWLDTIICGSMAP